MKYNTHSSFYRRLLGSLLGCTIAIGALQAQVYSETALLFSTHQYGGTARYQALGGAGTALGGDISAAYTNPAGLGFNRKSEISLSPTLQYAFSNAEYFDSNGSSSKVTPNLAHIGVTFSSEQNGPQAFKGGTFSISYSNVNNYNKSVSYGTLNDESFIVDQAWFDSDGILTHDQLLDEVNSGNIIDLAGLAFDTYLLNPVFDVCINGDCDNQVFFNDAYVTTRFEPMNQQFTSTTSGGQRAWNFSYGANFSDRVYIGASVGLYGINYEWEKTYTETPEQGIYEVDRLEFNESLRIQGQGIGLTLGAIVRPNDYFRLGVSFTTPTVYGITDTYSANLSVSYNDTNIVGSPFFFEDREYTYVYEAPQREMYSETGDLETTYTLYTPYRATAGVAVFLGKRGFISADLEYIGYNNMRFDNDELQNTFDSENDFVQDNYNNTVNFRLGAEMRLKPLYLRAGLQYQGNPSYDITDMENGQFGVSAGVGFRNSDFYADFTLTGRSNSREANPYFAGDLTPFAYISDNVVRGVLSFGVFF